MYTDQRFLIPDGLLEWLVHDDACELGADEVARLRAMLASGRCEQRDVLEAVAEEMLLFGVPTYA